MKIGLTTPKINNRTMWERGSNMTVGELIQELNNYDSEVEVVIHAHSHDGFVIVAPYEIEIHQYNDTTVAISGNESGEM